MKMVPIYYRGKYRSGEWCKHLRSFLKRVGNKRWRKEAMFEIIHEVRDEAIDLPYRKLRKKNKGIRVKVTIENSRGITRSKNKFYATLKQAEDAIKRNSVIRATIFEKGGKIIYQYENKNTQQAF